MERQTGSTFLPDTTSVVADLVVSLRRACGVGLRRPPDLALAHEPFSLRDCLSDALRAIAMKAHEKNLELTWRVAPDVPDHLLGDAGRLRQVVLNLVGNATKFTEHGEIALDITIESVGQVPD